MFWGAIFERVDCEQGRACAFAVRRHFGLILEDRTFFREKRLTFCEKKSRNFWSVERQKGLKGINV